MYINHSCLKMYTNLIEILKRIDMEINGIQIERYCIDVSDA